MWQVLPKSSPTLTRRAAGYCRSRADRRLSGQAGSRLAPTELRNLQQLTELSRLGKLSAEDQHVVAIVDWLLQYAFDSRASDTHPEPRRDTGNVRFRIDGILHDVYQLPAPLMPAIISRVKIRGRSDVV